MAPIYWSRINTSYTLPESSTVRKVRDSRRSRGRRIEPMNSDLRLAMPWNQRFLAASVRTRAEPRSSSNCTFSSPPMARKSIVQSSPRDTVATVRPKQCLVPVRTRSRWPGLARCRTSRCAYTARQQSFPANRVTVRFAYHGLSFEHGSRSATRSVEPVAPDTSTTPTRPRRFA